MQKMLYMDWYGEFQCVGGTCPLTCCGGWRIALKKEEIERYRTLSHPFGEKIREAIDEEEQQMRQENGRCILLTEDGWCGMVRECGEEYLSNTCTYFPRMVSEYGDIVEVTVEIVCPVVAGYLLRPQKITFGIKEINGDVKEEVDYQLYDALSLARTFLIEFFQAYDGEYYTGKLYILLMILNETVQLYKDNSLDKKNILDLLSRYEQAENCAAVFQAGEQIAGRMEVKAKKILELMVKLVQGEHLGQLFVYIKQNQIRKDLQDWIADPEQFQKDMEEFVLYFREHYNCMIENYFVYNLYRSWIPRRLRMEKFGKQLKVEVVEL